MLLLAERGPMSLLFSNERFFWSLTDNEMKIFYSIFNFGNSSTCYIWISHEKFVVPEISHIYPTQRPCPCQNFHFLRNNPNQHTHAHYTPFYPWLISGTTQYYTSYFTQYYTSYFTYCTFDMLLHRLGSWCVYRCCKMTRFLQSRYSPWYTHATFNTYCNTTLNTNCNTRLKTYCNTTLNTYCNTTLNTYCNTTLNTYCNTTLNTYRPGPSSSKPD